MGFKELVGKILPQDIAWFHERSDVDSSHRAQHHTLGTGPHQAAPGNHTHGSSGDASALPRILFSNPGNPDSGPIAEGSTGNDDTFTWQIEEEFNNELPVYELVPGTSTVKINRPGNYAIIWSLYGTDIDNARTTSGLRLNIYPQWNNSSTYDVTLQGGQLDGPEPTGTFLYYLSQENIDNGDNFVECNLSWFDFDAANFNGTYMDLAIQEVGGGAGPRGLTGPPGGILVDLGTHEEVEALPANRTLMFDLDVHQLALSLDEDHSVDSPTWAAGNKKDETLPLYAGFPNTGTEGNAGCFYQATGSLIHLQGFIRFKGTGIDSGSGEWLIYWPNYDNGSPYSAWYGPIHAYLGSGFYYDSSAGTFTPLFVVLGASGGGYRFLDPATGETLDNTNMTPAEDDYISYSMQYLSNLSSF